MKLYHFVLGIACGLLLACNPNKPNDNVGDEPHAPEGTTRLKREQLGGHEVSGTHDSLDLYGRKVDSNSVVRDTLAGPASKSQHRR